MPLGLRVSTVITPVASARTGRLWHAQTPYLVGEIVREERAESAGHFRADTERRVGLRLAADRERNIRKRFARDLVGPRAGFSAHVSVKVAPVPRPLVEYCATGFAGGASFAGMLPSPVTVTAVIANASADGRNRKVDAVVERDRIRNGVAGSRSRMQTAANSMLLVAAIVQPTMGLG